MAVMRTVIEDNAVAIIIDKAIQSYPRLQESYDGLKWRLSREPESGIVLPGNINKYLFKTAPQVLSLPTITVLYDFNDSAITINDLKITPQKQ
jgi:hypothetical protein